MLKRGSTKLSNRGLLDLANKFKSTIDDNEMPSQKNTDTSIVTSTSSANTAEVESSLRKEDSSSRVHAGERQPSRSEKLVTFSKWKNEIEQENEFLKNNTKDYEHELVPFKKWRNQTDSLYEGIKKAAQAVLPEMRSEDIEPEHEVEELFEEVLDIVPIEYLEEEKSFYTLEDFADLLNDENLNTKNPIEDEKIIEPIETETVANDIFIPLEEKKETAIILGKKSKSSKVADFFTFLLCTIGCIASLYAFYLSFNRSLSKANEEPIAVITFKYKSAQRKLSDRVLWDRVKQNTPIYNGDIIRTADLSEATITFYDGNVINLYDQSLAQIFFSEEGASIDFTGGEISIISSESSNGIQLVTEATTVDLAAGSSLAASIQTQMIDGILQANPSAPLEVQVMDGSASLFSEDTLVEHLLGEGEGLLFDNQEGSVIEPIVSVYSPVVNAKYLRQKGDTVPVFFSWDIPQDSKDTYVLELSEQKDFSIIPIQHTVTNLHAITVDMEDGMWYWRLYANTPDNGKSGKFRVLPSEAPKAIVPSFQELYTYASRPPSIRFLWTDDAYAINWLFEVSNNNEMDNPIISQITTQPSSIITTLEEGTWYWRATPSYPESIILEKKDIMTATQFKVSKLEDQVPVSLTFPMANDFLDTSIDQHFSWMHSVEADFYTISLSKNPDMTSPLFTERTKNNYYSIPSTEPILSDGNWYWAVTQTDSEGNSSPVGEIRPFLALKGTFKQEVLLPQDGEIISENSLESVHFTWDTNIPYDVFFQLSNSEGFESIISEIKSSANFVDGVSLPVGKWFWRIVSKNEDIGLEFASEAKSFFVEYELEAANILSPVSNSNLVVFPSEGISFVWDAAPNAQYYELQLFETSNRENPVYENLFVTETSLSLSMYSLPKTSYSLEVRAVVEETASGTIVKSDVSKVSFSTRAIEPIKLTNPRSGSVVDGISAVLSPQKVEWESFERVVESEFILSSQERGLSVSSRRSGINPRSSEIVMRVENPPNVITLPSLSEGTWYWTVIGKTDQGYDISAIEPNRIVVQPLELLPEAILLNPSHKEVFGIEYLSNNENINFSWQPVLDADTYTFILKDNNNSVILEEVLENKTSYHFEDLSLLDRGTFTWSVEAMRHLPNKAIQRGDIVTQSFVIDLPQIIIPKDNTLGDLYGQ